MAPGSGDVVTTRGENGLAMHKSMKLTWITVAACAAGLLSLATPSVASAATPSPLVLSARATPAALGPAGGRVHVTGRVSGTRSCRLELVSHQAFPVVYSHSPTTSCSDGSYSAYVLVGANPTRLRRTVAFALVAYDGRYSFTGRFYVSLAPNPHPSPPPPPPPPPPHPANRYPAGATGYDLSWPQCTKRGSATTKALPSDPTFAIVGVNDGTISGFNSCFAAEAAWAGPDLSAYIILQPAPRGRLLPNEATGPKAACAATDGGCAGYDWGYNYAEADVAFVDAQGLRPDMWWLDIETAEGWATSTSLQPVNAAVVQGALDAIKGAGYTGGVYSTWYQWGEITGSYVPQVALPIWVAGATSLSGGYYSAQSYCQRALSAGDPSTLRSAYIGFAGGAPWLVQYAYRPGPNPIDPDYSCG
ncbi:MAG: hypothetical protein ACRDZX_13110 [Acidimicrobiales bacterium]